MTATKFDQKKLSQSFQLAGLQERTAQFAMIEAAFDAFSKKQIACVEAPTGVGKTLAYGIAVLLAKTSAKNIVISTATIALQEQLLHKDIPLLEKVLGVKLNAGLAKGRRRYICHARLYQEHDDLLDKSTATKLQELLESRAWNGERDDLSLSIASEDWQKLSTDSSACSGSRCEFYEDCIFYKARRKALAADIIITNHSLLLSDLGLGGGVVLPPLADCAYVLDECHHFPEKALHHFAKQAAVMRSVDWLNVLSSSLSKLAQQAPTIKIEADQLANQIRQLVEALSLIRACLQNNLQLFDNDVWRLQDATPELETLAEPVVTIAQSLLQQVHVIIEGLDQSYTQHERSDNEKAAAIATLSASFNFVADRLENLFLTWRLFCQQRQPKQAPIARWFELKKTADGEQDFTCHTSPINVSHDLKMLLWDKIEHGALLCSATLRSLGKFDDFIRRVGLNGDKRLQTLAVESPFSYQQSLLMVPRMQNEPRGNEQREHLIEVAELLPELLPTNGGSLVLFTSKSALKTVFDFLSADIRQFILRQGDRGKAQLIRQHQQRVDQGQRSILFGLASFAEGLDLPGDYCRHVIIQKLPFAVPDDPIELTRSEWLQKNQLNPFMLSTLPATSLKLTQYVGRLLRTEADIGVVTILDKRLYTKAYGKQMLANLPKFTMMVNRPLDELKECMDEILSDNQVT